MSNDKDAQDSNHTNEIPPGDPDDGTHTSEPADDRSTDGGTEAGSSDTGRDISRSGGPGSDRQPGHEEPRNPDPRETVAEDDRSDEEEPTTTIDEALGSNVDEDMEIDEEMAEDDLLGGLKIDSSAEIKVPDRLVDQVIGQDHARDIVLKAAKQRRHVMMIGSPGTGKSMLAKAMSQLLPKEDLQDVLVYHNPDDGNEPKVRVVVDEDVL